MKISGRSLELLLFLSSAPNDEFTGFKMSRSLSIASGTLYPLLVKLEKAGLLASRWEVGDPSEMGRPRRRYYQITAEGRRTISERMSVINPNFGEVTGPIFAFKGVAQ